MAALQFYNLTTEVIHSVTSVTLKVTRDYKTKAGNLPINQQKGFIYQFFSDKTGFCITNKPV